MAALAGLLHGGQAWAPVLPLVMDRGSPARLLAEPIESEQETLIALGEMLFKNQALLDSSPMRTVGFFPTCDSCHPDGGTSQIVFFEGLSDRPGNIDTTNRAMTFLEDGIHNPINIPSMRGSDRSAPFARDGRFATLRDFTRFAIEEEFDGRTATPLILDALVAYQASLPYLDNLYLRDDGSLNDSAPPAARRGEVLFRKAFPDGSGRSCATCHVPEHDFLDGKRHDVGTGKAFDTPTLRDLATTAPYFHRGDADDLAATVAYFDGFFGLGLDDSQRADLTAYLAAVGAGALPPPPETTGFHPENGPVLIGFALEREDWRVAKMAARQIMNELDRARGHPDAPDDATLDRWIKRLRMTDGLINVEDYPGALAALSEWQSELAAASTGNPATDTAR